MNNERDVPNPAEPSDSSRQLAELKEQCERLQQVVQRLEEEDKLKTEALRAAMAALNESNRSALKWAAEQWSEETWKDFKEEEYNITAEELIEELERQEGPCV